MKVISLSHPTKLIKGEITLPSSKSISNRVLIIKSLCRENFEIENLSDSDDTKVLKNVLDEFAKNPKQVRTFDIAHAGTAMRFLTAFFATRDCSVILTGSDRMKKRPIKILVNALKQIGSDISYLENEGFPSIKIKGKPLKGGTIEMDASVSSQYISALLLIAPTLPLGLVLNFNSVPISKPYINMTLKTMESFGVYGTWNGNTLSVSPQSYNIKEELNKNYFIEPDWSSASYWYAMCALAKSAEIKINTLSVESIQGDKIIAHLFNFLNVRTKTEENGIAISNKKINIENFHFDFSDNPDVAQTIAVVCAALEIKSCLTGLSTLKIKETDRIIALKNELEKIGIQIKTSDNLIEILKSQIQNPKSEFLTYEDHRMAMSLAPLALIFDEIKINNPDVVAKSYPNFWNDLNKVGFVVEEV